MKYLFDMDDVWHLYIDAGNQWIYHRMERTGEEILDKNSDNLPGPLGRLDALKQLEEVCDGLKNQTIILEKEKQQLQASMEKQQQEIKEWQQRLHKKTQDTLEQQKREFEKNYNELKKMTEEMQKEGRLWRQRYLDLAYQVSHKEK